MNRLTKLRLGVCLGVLMAAAMSPACADTRVGVHVGSYHFEGDFNNFNPGAYVYHNGWTTGTYYNSERRQSVYAGYTFEHYLTADLSVAVTVGAITGYLRAPVLPLVLPSAAYKLTARDSVRIGFVPPVGKGSSAAVHVMFERSF